MDKPYSEFTEADWAEHFAQMKRGLEELKESLRIRPHWFEFKSLHIGPDGIWFNEGGRLFSFVWWRGRMVHLCLAILPHVWSLYWLRREGWKTRFRHEDWSGLDEPT